MSRGRLLLISQRRRRSGAALLAIGLGELGEFGSDHLVDEIVGLDASALSLADHATARDGCSPQRSIA